MTNRKYASSPPEWLDEKAMRADYSYLRNLDAAGWLSELKKCLRNVQDAEKRDAGKPTLEEEWGDFLGGTHDLVPEFIGPPAVQVVEKADLSTLHATEKPATLVQVYLRATDPVIIREFKKALADIRKKHPAPVKKKGPTAPNAKFDEGVFKRWVTQKIVPLAELIEWCSLNAPKVKSADFGRWLFPDASNTDKAINIARNTLHEALNSIPGLSMQVDLERRAAKPSPKLTPS